MDDFDLDPEAVRRLGYRAADLVADHRAGLLKRPVFGKVEVHLCRVADVRKPKGLAPGQVLLKRWDAVRIYPKGLEEPEDGD